MWYSTTYPLENNITTPDSVVTTKVLNTYDTCQCNPKNGGHGTCLCGYLKYPEIKKLK